MSCGGLSGFEWLDVANSIFSCLQSTCRIVTDLFGPKPERPEIVTDVAIQSLNIVANAFQCGATCTGRRFTENLPVSPQAISNVTGIISDASHPLATNGSLSGQDIANLAPRILLAGAHGARAIPAVSQHSNLSTFVDAVEFGSQMGGMISQTVQNLPVAIKLGNRLLQHISRWVNSEIDAASPLAAPSEQHDHRTEQPTHTPPEVETAHLAHLPTGNSFIDWLLELEDSSRWIDSTSHRILADTHSEEYQLLKRRYQEYFCEKERENLQKLLLNPASLPEIPFAFREQAPFKTICCPITKKPIRFAMTYDAEPENGNSRVYYERAAIITWCALRPNVRPQGWPQQTPCTRDRVRVARNIQKTIDEALEERAVQIREQLRRTHEINEL
jgi:hypothetical protein